MSPAHLPPASVAERRTARLTFRRPQADDLDFLHALHSDPVTFTHAPWARHTTLRDTVRMLEAWIQHWDEHGFGYWIAVETATEREVGIAGVRHATLDERSVLNLAYRVRADAHGSGLGREASREAVVFATEWLPELEVTAVIRPVNVASRRTAAQSGLTLTGETRLPDDPDDVDPSQVWTAARVGLESDPALEAPLVDLWHRVNEAGGSVGFYGPSTSEDVRERLIPHLNAVVEGLTLLGVMRDPADGSLLGFGFIEPGSQPMVRHVALLKRVMVDPTAERRNLGRLLMAGLHALARAEGVEISRLTYRGGTELGGFYERCGYREVGRVPGALKFATDDGYDIRDDVEMACRLDGRPL